MCKSFQPEYSWFPLSSDEFKEVIINSNKENIIEYIKDAICCCVSNSEWKTIIKKIVKK